MALQLEIAGRGIIEPQLTFNNLIEYSLLTGYNNIKLFLALLKLLGVGFDPPVSVQHVQETVLGVKRSIFPL